VFAGSVPEFYDRYLVPLIFEPYADDLVARLGWLDVGSILEIGAGSGVATRAMAAGLSESVSITATDLNEPMIDHARSRGSARPVTWQAADVTDLPFADVITEAVGRLFPEDPPLFLARTPHGYYDETTIQTDLSDGGFSVPAGFEAVDARSRAASCEAAAIAYCQGTPLRDEIEARDPARLGEATRVAGEAIRDRFGATAVDGKIRGYVITATKP
jgi:hypothetical protein